MDALSGYGIRHLDMPLTPEKIWTSIRQAQDPAQDPAPGSGPGSGAAPG
jgi:hypothetical protein